MLSSTDCGAALQHTAVNVFRFEIRTDVPSDLLSASAAGDVEHSHSGESSCSGSGSLTGEHG